MREWPWVAQAGHCPRSHMGGPENFLVRQSHHALSPGRMVVAEEGVHERELCPFAGRGREEVPAGSGAAEVGSRYQEAEELVMGPVD